MKISRILVSLLAVAIIFCTGSFNAQAALVNGSTLKIESGSYVTIEVSPGFYLSSPATGVDGIVTGTTQPPGSIDMWVWTGNPIFDFTVSPTNVLSASGSSATIDMSGWRTLFTNYTFNFGSGAWNNPSADWSGNVSGVAQIACGVDCGNGDSYVLQYTASVPVGDPSGFGGVHFGWHLQGTVTAVPLPAAVWLLGSGLAALVAVVQRRRKYMDERFRTYH